jgi:hypothetical protein
MEFVLHRDKIRHANSSIVVEVCKKENGKPYIQLVQSVVRNDQFVKQSKLVLNEKLLSGLLPVLQESLIKMKEQEPTYQPSAELLVENLSPLKVKEIINSYLKGVPVVDIALRFDFKRSTIESVLTANEIPILSDQELKPPKPSWNRRWKKGR